MTFFSLELRNMVHPSMVCSNILEITYSANFFCPNIYKLSPVSSNPLTLITINISLFQKTDKDLTFLPFIPIPTYIRLMLGISNATILILHGMRLMPICLLSVITVMYPNMDYLERPSTLAEYLPLLHLS